jgi:hypothetical protein
MIELTDLQRQEVGRLKNDPLRISDPVTKLEYVLMRAEVYDRLSRIMQEVDPSLFEFEELDKP